MAPLRAPWAALSPETGQGGGTGPAVYMGTLPPNGLAWDTYLKLTGWTKVREGTGYTQAHTHTGTHTGTQAHTQAHTSKCLL